MFKIFINYRYHSIYLYINVIFLDNRFVKNLPSFRARETSDSSLHLGYN